MADCTNPAVTVVVGEAGDIWLCTEHAPPHEVWTPEHIDGGEAL
jgi:hypothetical protein